MGTAKEIVMAVAIFSGTSDSQVMSQYEQLSLISIYYKLGGKKQIHVFVGVETTR